MSKHHSVSRRLSFLLFVTLLSIFTFAQDSLTTNPLSASAYCPGSPISVSYTTGITFPEGNVFTAQLSDASGNFSNPVIIGSVGATNSGTIYATLPENIIGDRFRIRVVASNGTIGRDNGSDLLIISMHQWESFSTTGTYCSGSSVPITIDSTQGGVSYQLYMDGSPQGPAVEGTGGTLNLTTVSKDGTYTVVATMAYAGGCSWEINGSVTIGSPEVFLVTGGGSYCDPSIGSSVGLSGSQEGVTYRLLLNGAMTGKTQQGTGQPISFTHLSDQGMYTIVAENEGGCTTTMRGEAQVYLNSALTTYTVTGGGQYCDGGTGVSVGLNGSARAIFYQLYVNGTKTGALLEGNGRALSFGLQITPGTYTVEALDTLTRCTSTMSGSAVVGASSVGSVVVTPSGPLSICPGGSVILMAPTGYSTYKWSTGGNITQSITVNKEGSYAVTVKDNQGCYGTSAPVVVSFSALPSPYNVTGGGQECSNVGLPVGVDTTEMNVSYQLYKDGVARGEQVQGTGNAISFGLQKQGGVYTVMATNASGCTNKMTGSAKVSLYPSPEVTIPELYVNPGIRTALEPNTIYPGYAPSEGLYLTADATGGTLSRNNGTYTWVFKNEQGEVLPLRTAYSAGIYTAIAIDKKGCTGEAQVAIRAINVSCGDDKVTVCKDGGSSCVFSAEVDNLLRNSGFRLGACPSAMLTSVRREAEGFEIAGTFSVRVLRNPSSSHFTLSLQGVRQEPVAIRVVDQLGRVVEAKQGVPANGTITVGDHYAAGMYFVEISQGRNKKMLKLIKGAE